MAGKKELHNRINARKAAIATKKPIVKATAKGSEKTIEILRLPSVKIFGTTTAIVPSAEKGQINDIFVEVGGKSIQIFKDNNWLPGVHPNIAEFLFYAVIGGAGTARGARQLGFAHWVNEQTPRFNGMGFTKDIHDYTVLVNYAKRGGMMVYPLQDLVAMCMLKAAAAKESFKRYPRQYEEKQPTVKKIEEAEVSIFL